MAAATAEVEHAAGRHRSNASGEAIKVGTARVGLARQIGVGVGAELAGNEALMRRVHRRFLQEGLPRLRRVYSSAAMASKSGSFAPPPGPGLPVVDLRGLRCPLPVLRTRKALRAMAPGARMLVLATDPLAGLDIPNLLRETGDVLEERSVRDGVQRFLVRKSA